MICQPLTCLLTEDTAKTSFRVEPTNIILEPFVIPELDNVWLSCKSPLYINFCIESGIPAIIKTLSI